MVVDALLSTLLNLVLFAGLPFLGYWLYHRLRHKRRFCDIAARAGLRLGEPRYLAYSAAIAAACVGILLAWQPPLATFTGPSSPQRGFVGLGWSGLSTTLALLYGMIKTGFAEEFLFRGLIAGSLARRMPLWAANLLQASIFLAPHLLVLIARPELWVVFARRIRRRAAERLAADQIRFFLRPLADPWRGEYRDLLVRRRRHCGLVRAICLSDFEPLYPVIPNAVRDLLSPAIEANPSLRSG